MNIFFYTVYYLWKFGAQKICLIKNTVEYGDNYSSGQSIINKSLHIVIICDEKNIEFFKFILFLLYKIIKLKGAKCKSYTMNCRVNEWSR